MESPSTAAAQAPNPAVERFARHVNPALVKLLGVLGYGRVLVSAKDVRVRDDQGRTYLDFLAAFGATSLGHNHPRLGARLSRFLAEDALHLNHVGPSLHQGDLAEALAARLPAPLEVSLFSLSGGEAVEAGLKLAIAATGRRGIVHCKGGFHGTNLGTLSVMSDPRMRRPFEPLLPDCHEIAFGDLGALEQRLRGSKIAAFLVEPILGEGGVDLPPPDYLREAQALCRRHGALLVLDEVQTGIGRTGTMFAFQPEGLVPDVLVLGKALGGGVTPIGATVTSRELHVRAYGSLERFDLHGSTYGGNALSCVCALETLAIVDDERLVENAAARGTQLLAGLQHRLAGHPFVREIRGRGLLVGVELGPTAIGLVNRVAPSVVEALSRNVFGQWAAVRLLEEGILCQPASHDWNVLRLEPPLTVQPSDIERAIDAVGRILDAYRELAPLLVDVTARVGSQLASGWSFR